MARKYEKENEATTATAEDAGDHVSFTVEYDLPKKAPLALAVSAAVHDHAMAVSGTLAKHERGSRIVASTPRFTDDDTHATVEFKVYSPKCAQADFEPTQTLESVRKFVDLVELTTACIAVGAEAAKKVEEGLANAPKMYEACKPQDALATLDENCNVIVAKSPLLYVQRHKKLLSAAGLITSLGIDAQYALQGKVARSPAIPIDATKTHRYADSSRTEVVPVTGYLRRSRIMEVEHEGKSLQLEVPEDYSEIAEQAAKADAWVRITLEVYKCTNPCLPDEPHLKIISVDEILGQAKLKLVV